MKCAHPFLSRAALTASALVLGSTASFGQVLIGGSVSDDTTGPLLSGVVYHATSTLSVPAGKTLTVQSGSIVKLSAAEWFLVYGTLQVQGTPASPAILTELRDDSAGGDTNGDGGASSPAPGAWSSLFFDTNSTGNSVVGLEVRYTGYNYAPGIVLQTGTTGVLEHGKVRYGYWTGLDLQGTNLGMSVHDCSFENNGGIAVANMRIDAVPNFLDNQASGNGGNYMQLSNGTVGSAPLRIQSANVLGGALVAPNGVVVPVGSQLTLGPSVVVKLGAATWFLVQGRLRVQATSARHAVITDLRDDSAGGDTNGDGSASAPAKGGWSGVHFYSTSAANDLAWLEVRYPGYNYASGISFEPGATAALNHVKLRDAYWAGADLQSGNLGASFYDCTFQDNGGIAVAGVPIDAVPNFTNNHAAGNGGNYMQLSNGTVGAAPIQIEAGNVLEGALVAPAGILVPHGSSLALGPGVVLKLGAAAWFVVRGTLTTLGDETNPVVLTEMRDDTSGGDTNNDGSASLPAKGAWSGLYFYWDATACSVRNLVARYGGYNFVAGVYTESGADLALEHLRVEHAYAGGVWLNSHTGEARRLVAWDCGGIGIGLLGGSFHVRQATAIGNGTGLQASGWSGSASDSISWNNAANFAGFSAANLGFCDGDPALAGANGNLDVAPLFVNEAAGNFHLLDGSPCVDAGDPASPADPDATRADMGAYALDQCVPAVYCQGKPNSLGCTPWLDSSGHASVSDPGPFLVRAHELLNNKLGLFIYGLNGPANQPFQGGTLCVQLPVKRANAQNSGGSPPPNDCSGVIAYDFNARIQSGIDPQLALGAVVWAQCWSRDPQDPFGTSLSNAIRFRICP